MSSSRYGHSGGVAVFSLAALLAGILLAGCGGAGTAGSPGVSTRIPASSSGSNAGSTKTAGASATSQGASAPTSTPRPVSLPGGRLLRRFAGSGNTRLGTIVVSSQEVLVWTARHPAIQIFTANGFMLVSSAAPNGSIQLSRGTYRDMRVASRAGWSIELRSRSS